VLLQNSGPAAASAFGTVSGQPVEASVNRDVFVMDPGQVPGEPGMAIPGSDQYDHDCSPHSSSAASLRLPLRSTIVRKSPCDRQDTSNDLRRERACARAAVHLDQHRVLVVHQPARPSEIPPAVAPKAAPITARVPVSHNVISAHHRLAGHPRACRSSCSARPGSAARPGPLPTCSRRRPWSGTGSARSRRPRDCATSGTASANCLTSPALVLAYGGWLGWYCKRASYALVCCVKQQVPPIGWAA
jgi:hypothetical protein